VSDYRPQYVNTPIDLEKTPHIDALRIFKERAAGYSRDLMEGAEGPYATVEEYTAILRQMGGRSRVRIANRRAYIVGRRMEGVWHDTDDGWVEVPLAATAELIRLGYLKRFQAERELDRIGWREMGWDGDVAEWYGWPA
jgi:hypothetical protein